MQLSFLLVALCLFPALVVPFPVQKVTGAEILQSYLGEPATADVRCPECVRNSGRSIAPQSVPLIHVQAFSSRSSLPA